MRVTGIDQQPCQPLRYNIVILLLKDNKKYIITLKKKACSKNEPWPVGTLLCSYINGKVQGNKMD